MYSVIKFTFSLLFLECGKYILKSIFKAVPFLLITFVIGTIYCKVTNNSFELNTKQNNKVISSISFDKNVIKNIAVEADLLANRTAQGFSQAKTWTENKIAQHKRPSLMMIATASTKN